MNLLKIVLCSLIFTAANFAQIEFEFNGYVNQIPIYQKNNDFYVDAFNIERNQFQDITRLRLKPSLFIGQNSSLHLEYEITSLYSNTDFIQPGFLFNNNERTLFDLNGNFIDESNFRLDHFIDRLYFTHNFENSKLQIGRQRISWGTGRIWNPTDLFNPINPTSFYKLEKDGTDAVSYKQYLGNFTDLELVFAPREELSASSFAGRFRTNYKEYDVSLMMGRFDFINIIGADLAGNLFDAGVRGEAIYAIDDDQSENNYLKFILGADYQFTPKLYGLIEYQYNGEGKTDKFNYKLSDLFQGRILNLSQNYIFVQSSYLLHPLVTTSLSSNTNLNDNSGFVSSSFAYNAMENLYITLGGQIFYGDELTEYWYFPNSFFAIIEYYF